MCGISGIICKNHRVNKEVSIKKMTDIIKHRGPDDEGYYIEKNIFFGHRRLSVIDLSDHGHQPMHYDKGQLVLTYNGEIYNYIELKHELQKYGYVFKTDSDSEVILASYHKWGQDCINHFNGMWAFSIHDKKNNYIFMSRDRFGIKPFYYMNDDSGFYFGSEIKQFTILEEIELTLNKKIALNFLLYGDLNTTEETFINRLLELKGGYNIIYNLSTNKFTKYKWYYLDNIKENNITLEEAEKEFEDHFRNSVKIRLRSDVKLGCLLSGGLDSSAIVGMVDILESNTFDTISSCFEDKKYDEQEYIDEVIKGRNINPNKIFPDLTELFSIEKLDKLIWYQDQPFRSSSHFAEYLVFESAKDNKLKVVLGGQGSDEVLAGYQGFFKVYLFELLSSLHLKIFFQELKAINQIHNYSYKSMIKSVISYSIPDSLKKIITKLFKKQLLPQWLHVNEMEIELLKKNKVIPKSLKEYSLDQIFVTSIPYQLHSEDRNSMSHSIESRLPFLDYKLIEFIISLPNHFKIYRGTTKYILREALKEVLPLKVKNRQNKMGFVTPEEVWMKQNINLVKSELLNAVESTNGMITKEIIVDFDAMISGKKRFSGHYFRIITFSRWLKVFNIKI